MKNWIKRLLARRRAYRQETERQRGFHWACNELYRKRMSAGEIRDKCKDRAPFDKGAIEAIDLFDRLVTLLKEPR